MGIAIRLEKEAFKFAGTHFTILSEKSAERLHGHNYQVRVEIEIEKTDPKLGMAFDFNLVKPVIKQLCDGLDEYVLLPQRSPFLKITEAADQVQVEFGPKSYLFPKEDVRQLPVVNLTSEELARYLADQLRTQFIQLIEFRQLTVTVEESRGQSVSFTVDR